VKTAAAALLALVACSRGSTGPAALDTRTEACAHCRMAVSDARFAAQLVAPREEPRFFDDVGCLRDDLRERRPPAGAVAYVADHRTKGWARASAAVYSRVPWLATPMGSHLVAHADAASRSADPDAAAGTPLSPAEVFGPAGPPDGAP
jgi:copper chaperone NosL